MIKKFNIKKGMKNMEKIENENFEYEQKFNNETEEMVELTEEQEEVVGGGCNSGSTRKLRMAFEVFAT